MKYVIAAGIVLALAIINGSFAERDEQIRAEAVRIAEEKKAQIFHVVAKCLNEPVTITVGGIPTASCRPLKAGQ